MDHVRLFRNAGDQPETDDFFATTPLRPGYEVEFKGEPTTGRFSTAAVIVKEEIMKRIFLILDYEKGSQNISIVH